MIRKLINRVAAIEKDALVAVDEGDVALAARRRSEAGVVGEDVGIAVKLADVDNVRPLGAGKDGQIELLVLVGEGGRAVRLDLAFSHHWLLEGAFRGIGAPWAISHCSKY